VKVVSIGDLHCRLDTTNLVEQLIGELDNQYDALLLAGDLTDNGLTEEAELLVRQLQQVSVPIVAILGNHDHHNGQEEQIATILRGAGIILLDGTVCEIGPLGIAGSKGFCGGFGETMVQPFGEAALKTFIRTSIDEAVALENALTNLQECQYKLVLLHYAPILATLVGEAPELFAFLGTGRLASAIDRRGADVVVHGHAHHGSPFGRTPENIPVHNVSRQVQMEHTGKPYCIIDLEELSKT
jgi:uncharacterized protein